VVRVMLWKAIAKLRGCERISPNDNFSRCFVIRTSVDETGWMIGPYEEMTRFATELRYDARLRDLLTSRHIRIGLRTTDVPPAGIERQVKCGPVVPGHDRDRDFTDERLTAMALPVREGTAWPINRKTDREQNVRTFLGDADSAVSPYRRVQ
jgi:hypothetical protein